MEKLKMMSDERKLFTCFYTLKKVSPFQDYFVKKIISYRVFYTSLLDAFKIILHDGMMFDCNNPGIMRCRDGNHLKNEISLSCRNH